MAILTPQQRSDILNQINEAIEKKIPQSFSLKNDPASRKYLRDALQEVVKEFNLEQVNVICDTTNNNDRVIKQNEIIADIYIVFDDPRIRSRIRFRKVPEIVPGFSR